MNEDLFKPLYKQHRRIPFDQLEDVVDPRNEGNEVSNSSYSLSRSSNNGWTCDALPGLRIHANALSLDQQRQLLHESLDDFLVSPEHLTNLDAHYELPRPIRLFDDTSCASRLPTEKAELVRQKIRWVTLGGQYRWTEKVYPSFTPGTPGCPLFPESLAKNICRDYGIKPEAAIVNYYEQGDILSPHQDVAELADQDLVSISLGCTCIFYVGLERYGQKPLAILLRSGDVVIMGGKSRYAFHGVGRVLAGTTPETLCSSESISDPAFKDWMSNHRVNINVRQMNS